MRLFLESATLKIVLGQLSEDRHQKEGNNKMDTEVRIVGRGAVHAMGIWLATVEYSFVQSESQDVEAKIYVTNGERDLSADSIFAEEMILELEDERWGRMIVLGGSASNGVYRVRIEGGLSASSARKVLTDNDCH